MVAISGIDGSGKGYMAAKIFDSLTAKGLKIAIVNGDGWLNLPEQRFNSDKPAEHFYFNAFRFREMFTQLILLCAIAQRLPSADHAVPASLIADQ